MLGAKARVIITAISSPGENIQVTIKKTLNMKILHISLHNGLKPRQIRKGKGAVSKAKSSIDRLAKAEGQFLKLNQA